jgi:hypothetical protein
MQSPSCFCVWVCPHKFLNAWANLYETWYVRVCHGNWTHLNGVLHKSLPSVCVSVCVSLLSLQVHCSVKCVPPFGARQQLGKHFLAATNTRNNRRIVGQVILCAVCGSVCESPLWYPWYQHSAILKCTRIRKYYSVPEFGNIMLHFVLEAPTRNMKHKPPPVLIWSAFFFLQIWLIPWFRNPPLFA